MGLFYWTADRTIHPERFEFVHLDLSSDVVYDTYRAYNVLFVDVWPTTRCCNASTRPAPFSGLSVTLLIKRRLPIATLRLLFHRIAFQHLPPNQVLFFYSSKSPGTSHRNHQDTSNSKRPATRPIQLMDYSSSKPLEPVPTLRPLPANPLTVGLRPTGAGDPGAPRADLEQVLPIRQRETGGECAGIRRLSLYGLFLIISTEVV
ncbi:unnamed protein product [Phytophthora fragariaefolia]|uniref:Unnamed protein product n=2 Tax=Phytophthora fragariaefolia TaxID=1490495 RepID=A0A9W6Y1P1_9STRA|nr:unnamed protein product [Phytophthora fragariaefolia]